MTLSPPTPPANFAAQALQSAPAIFDAAQKPAQWLEDGVRVGIRCPDARIVHATPAALELFGAKDLGELARRLVIGEGPIARRLRHLAAAEPVSQAMRLERLRFVVGRRPTSLNMHCARIATPEGATFLLLSARAAVEGSVQPAQPAPRTLAEAPTRARFLWTLDAEGRFGDPHPILVSTVGVNAPQRGETLEALCRRIGMEHDGELARSLAARATFSEVTIGWPLPGVARQLRTALSAAPTFDGHRNFTGHRGFGVLGEAFDSPGPQTAAAPAAEPGPNAGRTVPLRGEPPVGAESRDGADMKEGAEEAGGAKSRRQPADSDGSGLVVPQALAGAPDERDPEPAGGADPDESFADGAKAGEPRSPIGRIADAVAKLLDAPTHDIAAPSVPNPPSSAPHERSAEIFVLRQGNAGAAQTKVVPIRPGALEAPAARDAAQAAPGQSVELSKSERDAFREIARALVGRTAASRDDRVGEPNSTNPVGDARDLLDHAFPATFAPPPAAEGQSSAFVAVRDERLEGNAAAILDHLPIGVLVVSDARALYLNRALLDLLGYEDLAHFRAADGLAAVFQERDPQAMGPQDGGALRIVKADGQSLSVEGRAQAIVWDGGPATLMTFRRLPEEDLEMTRARDGAAEEVREMLDRATDGVVILDSAAHILSLNESAERLFGYDPSEIAGESLLTLLAPQSCAEAAGRFDSLSHEGEADASSRPLRIVGRDKNGAALALALTLARIGRPEAPRYCALFRDLARERETERRLTAARDAAQEASAAKTGFLAKVSHEIRTPLHAILGIAEVMMEERFGPIGNERYRDYLKDIHSSGQYVMSLADDLLDLNKIESGRLDLAFAPVDANVLIRECVALMQPQAARERIIMRLSLFDQLPRVMADERSLKQIMLNLISNAVKFNDPGGQVIVSSAVDASGQAVIRVRDTGAGMSESEVGLALEPFSQVGNARRKGGAGLGLPLTKALVEANKAELTIKSRREQGTLVEIAFPKMQAAQ